MAPSRLLASLALCAAMLLAPLPSVAWDPGPEARPQTAEGRLLHEFRRFAAMTDGSVGIAVRRIGSDTTIALNGNTLFPMASVYKVAVAGATLALVDRGQLRLDSVITVTPAMMAASGRLPDRTPEPGVTLTVQHLLDLMLTRSDNGATDVLVDQVGGPQAVTAWLRSVGIADQRVDDNTAQLLYRAMGIVPTTGSYHVNVNAALAADPALRLRESMDLPNLAFAADPRDTSTPQAMTDLLMKIVERQALKPESARLLIGIMAHCRTGERRLKGLLPPGTPIAHKTGTLNGTGNDVGIIDLPGGGGFVIAIFVMKDSKGAQTRDRIMAEAARAAYDYYLFTQV